MNRKNHTLRITAANQPTVMERMLQITRYRGFVVTGMTMYQVKQNSLLTIELSVQSTNSITHLQSQLYKLIDITDIKVDNSASALCRA